MTQPKQVSPQSLEATLAEIQQELAAGAGNPISRVECTPETIDKGLARLVLSLIELLRKLLERNAIRRMEGGSLTDQQVEEMGAALMRLEQKIAELAGQFGLKPEELNLDLGPLGTLNPRE